MLINARNRSVAIEDGRIVDERGSFELVIACPQADVRTGLINAHDHLHRNHYGRLGCGPYPNAYRWAGDIQRRFRGRIECGRRMPRRRALLVGAWKNLFAGVTTVVHHDCWEPHFDRDFPIRVAQVASADSLGMAERIEAPASGSFCLHLAEGTDFLAASEVAAAGARGLLNERLIAVHGVGIAAQEVEVFRRSGAALTFCLTSNNFLFGRSAPAALFEGGVDVLLGSDSRLTGAGDLLDEIQAVRAARIMDDQRLEAAVGPLCARRLGLAEPSLEPGSPADLVLLEKPLTSARSNDVVLTIVGGVPRVARSDLARSFGRLAETGSMMRLGGVERWVNLRGGMV